MSKIETVQPRPEEATTMPYAPAVSVETPAELVFISGATSSPLYHKHPTCPKSTSNRTTFASRRAARWRTSRWFSIIKS